MRQWLARLGGQAGPGGPGLGGRAAFARLAGPTPLSKLGAVLVGLGLLLVVYSTSAYLGLAPGGYTSVPEPVALGSGQREAKLDPTLLENLADRPGRPARPTAATAARNPFLPPARTAVPLAPLPGQLTGPQPAPTAAVVAPAVALKLEPADAEDRRLAARAARPGLPVRLRLESVDIDTEVREGGVVRGKNGEWEWETLPFVATSYPFLGPVGLTGNPVISGHVVTLNEGNVFRDLYKVKLGESIEVFTDRARFEYLVDEIKLVPPTAVEVLLPTGDARLTVITCGGTFDPRTRTFSERLIVVGKLVGGERL